MTRIELLTRTEFCFGSGFFYSLLLQLKLPCTGSVIVIFLSLHLREIPIVFCFTSSTVQAKSRMHLWPSFKSNLHQINSYLSNSKHVNLTARTPVEEMQVSNWPQHQSYLLLNLMCLSIDKVVKMFIIQHVKSSK